MAANSEPVTKESGPARRRGRGRPWKPGQSGNPSGLPKDIAPAVAECRRLALEHVPYAISRLVLLLDSEDERVVREAATALMDRAGVGPRSWEPERVEITATVDVDALRASIAQRVADLVLARETAAALPDDADHHPEAAGVGATFQGVGTTSATGVTAPGENSLDSSPRNQG